ncbi:Uncharacterised protein [Vibrio cholerae]|nr:Uncharacterised protein [Vibrio cholerae]CSB41264.1 Uncharacterised protein [Vibrio cholerae]CSB42159.1 Uncharacterised protein [Vibrio cholerae]CSB54985.1 Uncharacterised protein [Vibrio cholerae]CSB64614.1 Uncharacterised protein [Vibrio cholerae]
MLTPTWPVAMIIIASSMGVRRKRVEVCAFMAESLYWQLSFDNLANWK